MPEPPTRDEIYKRAEKEGKRRLTDSALEQGASAFIAGVTIVFGVVALGLVWGLLEPVVGTGPAALAGALAFAIGLVFLVIGRTELFSENFFDPVAAAWGDRRPGSLLRLLRLWGVSIVLNLVGGVVMTAIFAVEGTLPHEARQALAHVAEEIIRQDGLATFTRAVAAGALLTLLSYLLHGSGNAIGRIAVAYFVGFFLALGPFGHVVVTAVHLLFGIWFGAPIGYGALVVTVLIATAGNLVGGLLLMTLTHAVQEKGSDSDAPGG